MLTIFRLTKKMTDIPKKFDDRKVVNKEFFTESINTNHLRFVVRQHPLQLQLLLVQQNE